MNWFRSIRVVFEGETASWELSRTGRYDLMQAYTRKPHRRLAEAIDDDSLKSFVRAWGPLRIRLDAWSGIDPINVYRHERDRFRAWVLLLAAIQKSEGLHEAALQLLKLDSEPFGIEIRRRLGIPGELKTALDEAALVRVAEATESEILDVCDYLVGSLPVPPPSLEIKGTRRAKTLRPTVGSYSLLSALYWMVWQDIFMETPFRFCEECNRLIDFPDKHDRKFCGPKCAHNQTSREWQRRKRKSGR
jgi:hypothetical protein